MTDITFSEHEIKEIMSAKLVTDLSQQRTPQAFFNAMIWPNQALDGVITKTRHELAEHMGLQCAPDCNACCTIIRIATQPVFLVFSWLWYHANGFNHAALDIEGEMGCSFYIDKRCSIYPARPSVCRIFHSVDRASCDRGSFDEDTTVRIAPPLVVGVVQGVHDAMSILGIHNPMIHLKPAVRILETTPDAVPRWLAGEPIFAAAERHVDQQPHSD